MLQNTTKQFFLGKKSCNFLLSRGTGTENNRVEALSAAVHYFEQPASDERREQTVNLPPDRVNYLDPKVSFN